MGQKLVIEGPFWEGVAVADEAARVASFYPPWAAGRPRRASLTGKRSGVALQKLDCGPTQEAAQNDPSLSAKGVLIDRGPIRRVNLHSLLRTV